MRRALSLVLLLGAPGCKDNVSTPPGTEILDWHLAQADSPEVAHAKELGPHASKDTKFRARPERKGTADFAVHVETGLVRMDLAESKDPHAVPDVVRITVERNEDWTLSTHCHGPSFRPPSALAAVLDEDLILHCVINMRYSDRFNKLPFEIALEIGGDGSAKPTLENGTITVE